MNEREGQSQPYCLALQPDNAVAAGAQGPSQGCLGSSPSRQTLTNPTVASLETANFPITPPSPLSPLGPEMYGAVPSETLIQLVLDAPHTLKQQRCEGTPSFFHS